MSDSTRFDNTTDHPGQNKPQRVIFIDPRSFRTEFVDTVQADERDDILILEFFQTLPAGVSEGENEIPYRISSRLAFTWEHAERLRDMLNRLIEKRNNPEK